MLETLNSTLEIVGLAWLLLASLIAGTVYGFAGFGAALVYMPVAVIFLPPAVAIAASSVAAMSSVVTVLPKALPLVDRKAVSIQIVSATFSASIGIWVLTVADVLALRWAVVVICAASLIGLMSGWRYAVTPTTRTRASVGLAAGFLGGVSGLTGPIMVLFQLAGRDPIAVTRATTAVFLTCTSVLILPLMYVQGVLTAYAVTLGLVSLVPYGAGALIGQALFRPERERFYRFMAYGIIAVATILGLPLWDVS